MSTIRNGNHLEDSAHRQAEKALHYARSEKSWRLMNGLKFGKFLVFFVSSSAIFYRTGKAKQKEKIFFRKDLTFSLFRVYL